jgi:hypothetical protein
MITFGDHIFGIIRKIVEGDLDWRVPVFEWGRHLIAFDGTALLLNKIYDQTLL